MSSERVLNLDFFLHPDFNKFRKLYADDGYFGPHIDDAKFIIDTYGSQLYLP